MAIIDPKDITIHDTPGSLDIKVGTSKATARKTDRRVTPGSFHDRIDRHKPVGKMPRGFANFLDDDYIESLGYNKTVKFTPELIQKIMDSVGTGCSIETAFRVNRVSPRRFQTFKNQVLYGHEPFLSIWHELEAKQAETEVKLLSKLVDPETNQRLAGQAIWLLERLMPDRYGPLAPRNNKKEITHKEEKRVTVRMELDNRLPESIKSEAKRRALMAADENYQAEVLDLTEVKAN